MILTRNMKIDKSNNHYIHIVLWNLVFSLTNKLYSSLQVATQLIELSLSVSI